MKRNCKYIKKEYKKIKLKDKLFQNKKCQEKNYNYKNRCRY